MGLFLKDMDLKGKTSLITGATKGIGRGTAIALAQAGSNIIAVGRNQNELDSLKNTRKLSGYNNGLNRYEIDSKDLLFLWWPFNSNTFEYINQLSRYEVSRHRYQYTRHQAT